MYDKLNDNRTTINKQIQKIINQIYNTLMNIYYIYSLCYLSNTSIIIPPFMTIIFHKFNLSICITTLIVSRFNILHACIISEVLQYIDKPKLIYFISTETIQFIKDKQLNYIDPSIVYITFTYCVSSVISQTHELYLFLLFNVTYIPLYKTIYTNILQEHSIVLIKHNIIMWCMLCFGYLSNYSFIHMLLIPWILNTYMYFLIETWRYKKHKPIINIENYF